MDGLVGECMHGWTHAKTQHNVLHSEVTGCFCAVQCHTCISKHSYAMGRVAAVIAM